MEFEKFNELDLKKVKKDKNNNMLPSAGVFLFLVMITISQFFLNTISSEYCLILLIISALASFMLYRFLTRKHRLDIYNQKVVLILSTVKDKVDKKEYEPGSASLPGQFNKEMKELNIYYLIIDNKRIFVSKEDYEKVEKGEEIKSRWSENTKLFLGIKKGDQFINIVQTSGENRLYV